MVSRINKTTITTAIKLLNFAVILKRGLLGIFSFGIIVACFIASIILLHPFFQKLLLNLKHLSEVYLASGALIGTILALVVSLSVIPIQKSVEILTTSITQIYRNDFKLITIFFLLSVFCITSILMSINGLFGLRNNFLLPAQIMILGFSIQLVRSFQNRVAYLLMPDSAIRRLFEFNKKYIKKASKIIDILTWIIFLFEKDRQNIDKEKIQTKSILFTRSVLIAKVINNIYEISEIAKKAINRGEVHLVKTSISSLSATLCYYLNIRKNNIVLKLEDLIGVYGCDADNLLIPIYEEFQIINKFAIKNNYEIISQFIIENLGDIAIFLSSLESKSFKKYHSPLEWRPVAYLKNCIKHAYSANMLDAQLTGARIYSKISKYTLSETDLFTLINNLNEICIQYFLSGNELLVNEVIKEMMIVVHYLIMKEYFRLGILLKELLSKFKDLLPLGIQYEKSRNNVMYIPMSIPYDLSNELSIGYFFNRAANLIKDDEKREWVSPYSNFTPIFKAIWRHFRDLGDEVDFKSSFLLFHMDETISHICEHSLNIIEDGKTKEWDTSDILKCVKWLLSFYWSAYSKMSVITGIRAEDSADKLSKIGLTYYSKGYLDVTESCASNINSIATQYIKKRENRDYFDCADIFMKIKILAKYATASGNYEFADKIKRKIKKPEELSEEKWDEILLKINEREKQLDEKLQQFEYDYGVAIGRSEDLLKSLINKLPQDVS